MNCYLNIWKQSVHISFNNILNIAKFSRFFKTLTKIQIPIFFPHFLSNQTQAQVEGKKKIHRNTNLIPQNAHNQKKKKRKEKKKSEILENEEQAKRGPLRRRDSSSESKGSRRRASSATGPAGQRLWFRSAMNSIAAAWDLYLTSTASCESRQWSHYHERLRRLIGASSSSRRSRRRRWRRRRHVLRPNPTWISKSKHLLHKAQI